MQTRATRKEIILDTIIDLHNQEQIVTRQLLAQVLGFKSNTITNNLLTLMEQGYIYRVERGIYAPTDQHAPARVISKIVLSDGTVKLDIGDDVLTLTPKEARILGSLMYCDAIQYSNIETGRQAAIANATIALSLKDTHLEMRQLASQLVTAVATKLHKQDE